jgi:hypothetical protein
MLIIYWRTFYLLFFSFSIYFPPSSSLGPIVDYVQRGQLWVHTVAFKLRNRTALSDTQQST